MDEIYNRAPKDGFTACWRGQTDGSRMLNVETLSIHSSVNPGLPDLHPNFLITMHTVARFNIKRLIKLRHIG